MSTKKINQLHPPLPKKKCVDDKGNKKCTVYVKVKNGKSTATVSLAEFNATNGGIALTDAIGRVVDNLGGKILCDFLVRLLYDYNILYNHRNLLLCLWNIDSSTCIQ